MEQLTGSITLILAIAMVLIGLPSQIIKNYKEKRCGMAILMVVLPLAVYLSRTTYTFTINAWYIFIPDALGALFSIIILVQFFYYSRKKSPKN